MIVSLYTSRIVLEALGVDNYGIYNVVGGVVSMFSVISGSLSSSISRFLTFSLGEGNADKLRKIFSTSLNIETIIGITIWIIGEAAGIWFVNHKLNIPPDKIIAAHWVLQCSLASFFIGLISVPYNACIIAHEKMNVFAYMTFIDVAFKLLFAYAIFLTPYDKLITYSVLLLLISLTMRFVYAIYCVRHFEECKYEFARWDKNLIKEMTSFAWWGFFGNTAWMFNTQGVNILINMFFGVAFNAARGVVGQVEGAVMSFVNNFTTALSPQITKSYASNDTQYLFSVICKGAKFSFFLMLFFIIPLWFESNKVLHLWLGDEVPPLTALFLKLSLISSCMVTYGGTAYTAIMATGNIRNYQIVITTVGCLVFPLTYIAYRLKLPIQTSYYIFMFIYAILIGIRVFFLKKLMGFPPMMFLTKAIIPSLIIVVFAVIPPYGLTLLMHESFLRVICTTLISAASILIMIWLFGLTLNEKNRIKGFTFRVFRNAKAYAKKNHITYKKNNKIQFLWHSRHKCICKYCSKIAKQ